jgi:uncharacterized protein with GYD domain
MATYIVLTQFTEQGVRNVKDTTKRADAVRDLAKTVGATLKEVYWTLGRYDVIIILEAPDDKVITAFGLSISRLGNVRTETLPAFSKAEMEAILKNVV